MSSVRLVLRAIASHRPWLRKLVPAFEPPVAVQPPLVWMPTATLPPPSTITGLPELPPSVSAV